VGLIVTVKLAEKFKATEEKYLIIAVVGGAIGIRAVPAGSPRSDTRSAQRQRAMQTHT
jgi:hypothetical protein